MDSRRHFLRGLARVAAGGGRPAGSPEATATLAEDPAGEAAHDPAAPTPPEPVGVDRYAVALADPRWGRAAQDALERSSVLVIGAGALGTPVLGYLVGAGVGRLGVLDAGDVALDDLHAETIHFTPDVGVPKAHSAAAKLAFLNPEVVVEPYQVHLDAENAENLLAGQDLVVDCSSSEPSRADVARACAGLGVPLVTGAAQADGGWVISAPAGEHACPACAGTEVVGRSGVHVGTVAGLVGSLLAREALDRLAAPGATPASVLRLDLVAPGLTRSALTRRPDCPICAGR